MDFQPADLNASPRSMGSGDREPALELAALGDFSIDEHRPIKVVVIGTGFSGIVAGIRFAQKVQNIDLTIYDKNGGIGGTWYMNKYPGVACDVPSHSYQYTFEGNPNWSAFYAPGSDILGYLERVVEKYKLMKYIKLNHELVHAKYDEPSGKWKLRMLRGPETAREEFEDTADVFFAAVGTFNRWHWPDIPGLDDFKGRLVHSANWDVGEGLNDWSDKRIGVIGAGCSAIQLVPTLQPKVAHLDNFVRSATWLLPTFSSEILAKFTNEDAGNYVFTDKDKQAFQDPEYYKEFRHELEEHMNANYQITLTGSKMQNETRVIVVENMTKSLAKKPWIAKHLIPDFPVACRRPSPGPGYLAALCEDNVDFIATGIRRVTSDGIELSDGEHRVLDVLICATGYDTTYQYPFPIIGRNGTTIQSKWKPFPRTYLSICVDEFPNMFFGFGPNTAPTSGLLVPVMERQVEYAVAATLKIQRERLKSLEVKKVAVEDFDGYVERYFKKTVFSEKCSTWHKMGREEGRVTALWPGTAAHAMKTMANPRWEDFDYEAVDTNRFYWLGDGQTFNEKTLTGNRAWYLDDKEVDVPPVPK